MKSIETIGLKHQELLKETSSTEALNILIDVFGPKEVSEWLESKIQSGIKFSEPEYTKEGMIDLIKEEFPNAIITRIREE